MNKRLKESIDAAEAVLPEHGQTALAEMIDLFAAHYVRDVQSDFSPEQLAEIDKIAAEPFVAADPVKVAEFFGHDGASDRAK